MESPADGQRVLGQIDLTGATPVWLWHHYSDGVAEKELLGDWWDAFYNERWQAHTYWGIFLASGTRRSAIC